MADGNMTAEQAELSLKELFENHNRAKTFEDFVSFVVDCSKNGFSVMPYSSIVGQGTEYGATVWGHFPKEDGELMEVAVNPIVDIG